ncbi:MAG: hypothetical protein WC450_07225 [Candidatus Omnitrophota bacterium]
MKTYSGNNGAKIDVEGPPFEPITLPKDYEYPPPELANQPNDPVSSPSENGPNTGVNYSGGSDEPEITGGHDNISGGRGRTRPKHQYGDARRRRDQLKTEKGDERRDKQIKDKKKRKKRGKKRRGSRR